MKRFLVLAVAVLACAAVAESQGMPPGKWWQRAEVIQELELTRDQQNRLDEIFRGAANELIDAKGEVEKLQVAIRGEMDRPQIRRSELQKIATQLSAARGKLFERELMMLVDMRAVLNEQQWAKARRFLDRVQERRQQAHPRRRR